MTSFGPCETALLRKFFKKSWETYKSRKCEVILTTSFLLSTNSECTNQLALIALITVLIENVARDPMKCARARLLWRVTALPAFMHLSAMDEKSKFIVFVRLSSLTITESSTVPAAFCQSFSQRLSAACSQKIFSSYQVKMMIYEWKMFLRLVVFKTQIFSSRRIKLNINYSFNFVIVTFLFFNQRGSRVTKSLHFQKKKC